jgi:hypothetical protein
MIAALVMNIKVQGGGRSSPLDIYGDNLSENFEAARNSEASWQSN